MPTLSSSLFDVTEANNWVSLVGGVLTIIGVGFAIWRWIWPRGKEIVTRGKQGPRQQRHVENHHVGGDLSAKLLERVRSVGRIEHPAVALVGAVYLDVELYPVDTEHLDDHEWADIEPLELRPGGAAYYVGKYLSEDYGRRSSLFSGFGSEEPGLSQSLASRISAEGWLENDLAPLQVDGQSAISVHLVRRDRARTATFTHRGAVASLCWPRIDSQLDEALADGGVLFLSGYFKTDLHTGLGSKLRRLRDRVLVIADPGSIDVSSTDPSQMQNLREALQIGHIDVHITNLGDFLKVYDRGGAVKRPQSLAELEALLPSLAGRLAPVVILRGSDLPDRLAMVCIAVGKISATEADHNGVTRRASSVGARNSFSASLIDRILSPSDPEADAATLEDLATVWCRSSLEDWKVACQR